MSQPALLMKRAIHNTLRQFVMIAYSFVSNLDAAVPNTKNNIPEGVAFKPVYQLVPGPVGAMTAKTRAQHL